MKNIVELNNQEVTTVAGGVSTKCITNCCLCGLFIAACPQVVIVPIVAIGTATVFIVAACVAASG